MRGPVFMRWSAPLLLSMLLAACATPQAQLSAAGESVAADSARDSDASLRVLTLNVAHARGTGFNQVFQSSERARSNLDDIARLIKQQAPDIGSLQEVDRHSFWNGRFDHVDYLARQGGFQHSFAGDHMQSMGLNYGTAVVAKLDLQQPRSFTFEGESSSASKGFVLSTVRWPGKECVEVDVVSAHLDFTSPQSRREQAAEMVAVLQERGRPIIIMGDFNSGWGRGNSAVRKLARELNLHSYEPEDRSLVTIPKFKLRLDWILVSPEIDFQNYRVLEQRVSDHLGVVSDLVINRACG